MLAPMDGRGIPTHGAGEVNVGIAEPTASHRTRAILMERLRQLMASRRCTQVQAAAWFHVSQSRISHLVNNQINRFTTDTLINMLSHAGLETQITFTRAEREARTGSHLNKRPGDQESLWR